MSTSSPGPSSLSNVQHLSLPQSHQSIEVAPLPPSPPAGQVPQLADEDIRPQVIERSPSGTDDPSSPLGSDHSYPPSSPQHHSSHLPSVRRSSRRTRGSSTQHPRPSRMSPSGERAPPPRLVPIPSEPPPSYDLAVRFENFISPTRNPSSSRGGRATRAREPRTPPPPRPSTSSEAPTTVGHGAPPPFGAADSPAPQYGAKTSAETMPELLFYYGFFFPLFWVIGSLILCIGLQPIPEEECGRTAAEQAEVLAILRQTEKKWAFRCLYALSALLTVVGVVTTGVVLGTR